MASFLDLPDAAEESDIKSPLIDSKSPTAKPAWSSDSADLFILLCSFLFISTSTVYVALVFYTAGSYSGSIPYAALSLLQRAISTLSLTVTSAVIMLFGKRYVLFRLGRDGLRSRRVAVYSNPSIGNLASHLVLHGVEFPLLALSAVWGLALVTGLTVNDSWGMGSISDVMPPLVVSGSLESTTPDSSYLLVAFEQLGIVMSSLCLGVSGTFGLINITNPGATADQPTGVVYYPPVPQWAVDIGFSYSTTINGFNISMDQLSSVPSSSQNLTCTGTYFPNVELWFSGSDNQTLSIVVVYLSDSNSIFRFNATPIVMGGTMTSTGNYTEFALNGTSWPNVMATDDQWAQDITSLICNATCPNTGDCGLASSLSDFADLLNAWFQSQPTTVQDGAYTLWSSVLGMALGAYSSAVLAPTIISILEDGGDSVPITMYNRVLATRYGIYILTVNIVVSVIMLILVVRLRLASRLGGDFINSTRLLLDPLKKPELFNAPLTKTVDALSDPYMFVKEDSVFLLEEQKSKGTGRWTSAFALRRQNRSSPPLQ